MYEKHPFYSMIGVQYPLFHPSLNNMHKKNMYFLCLLIIKLNIPFLQGVTSLKYKIKNTGLFIFFQILMCIILFVSCIYIHMCENEKSISAGAFGKTQPNENLTFSDLATVLEKAVCIK